MRSLPALLELITTSSASGFLDWAFRPGPHLFSPLCYRFEVTGPVARRIDFVIEGDKAHIEEAGDRSPSVTLHCDSETYLLIMYGRLTLEAARALGRLRMQGDQSLTATFAQWFKGA